MAISSAPAWCMQSSVCKDQELRQSIANAESSICIVVLSQRVCHASNMTTRLRLPSGASSAHHSVIWIPMRALLETCSQHRLSNREQRLPGDMVAFICFSLATNIWQRNKTREFCCCIVVKKHSGACR